jgi:hypothetical protein
MAGKRRVLTIPFREAWLHAIPFLVAFALSLTICIHAWSAAAHESALTTAVSLPLTSPDTRSVCCAHNSTNCPVPCRNAGTQRVSVPLLASLSSLPAVGWIFDTSNFPPRWYCGTWSAALGWTHIVSDFAIFGAYSAIPLAIAYFVLRRRDVPFLPIFWLFVAFIFFCGFGHFVEAVIFWNPWYRFSGLVKACTAIVSWVTVIALIPVLPKALALPGLATVNRQLEAEVAERQAAEEKLQKSYDELRDFTRNVLDREDRLIELRQDINGLLRELGRKPRYSIESTGG